VIARPFVLVIAEPGPEATGLCGALQDEGCDVVVASERDAADLLSARSVDCVVLPFETTAGALRERIGAADVPVLMTLATANDSLAAGALEAGADDCAPLSDDLTVLKARVRALVRRTRAARARTAALAEALTRKDKELASLNYAVSHDLRAPLRAIDGFGRIVLEECAGTLDGRHVGYVQRIVSAAHELGVLIDDLLQLSRVGRAELRPGRVDVTEIARRIAADLQAASPRAAEMVIDDGLVLHGDRTLMRLAFEHLLGNSWKFTAPVAAARIECHAERSGGETVVVVRDNGVGFDPARADKLFQPFQRLHGSEFEGAGIGLAVVQKIAARHGGRVWAEGRQGGGASVFFALPSSGADAPADAVMGGRAS
jgi:light-regulated signal transduction histidine kinase (bacteriophytochrome)